MNWYYSDRIKGGIIGACLGDALGIPHKLSCQENIKYTGLLQKGKVRIFPYEYDFVNFNGLVYSKRKQTNENENIIKEIIPCEFIEKNNIHLGKKWIRCLTLGQISGNSEMMIVLLRTIVQHRGYLPIIYIEKCLDWANSKQPMMGKITRLLMKDITKYSSFERRYF